MRGMPPRPPGFDRTAESFTGQAGLAFDPQGAVASAANLTCSLLFEPTRATRLAEEHARDASLPGLDEVIHATLAATWFEEPQPGMPGETARTVRTAVLNHLLALSAGKSSSPEARDVAGAQVEELKGWLLGHTSPAPATAAQQAAALRIIARWEKDPAAFASPEMLAAPPGQPIGSDADPDGE